MDELLRKEVKKDHDTLIEIKTLVKGVCVKIDRITASNDQQHKEIFELIREDHNKTTEEIKNMMPWKHFKYIFSGVMSVVAAGMIFIGSIALSNQNNMKSFIHEFEDHSAFAAIAWEKFTGEPWGAASRMQLQEAKEKYKTLRQEALEKEKIKNDK